ncbi:ESPR domain-containing protein [uncultured Mitsuokella sp.]|uniref:ESPR domain-containing protein n=1 Tax=uncultured Mitsuokella sp. TaxID=453120 RepID=UPI00343BB805
MNKIFKVIYSKVRGCYVVVSEISRSNGKTRARHEKKEQPWRAARRRGAGSQFVRC